MKKIFQFLFFAFIALLSSCSVYEDIYFASDGKIKYEVLVDASRVLSVIPSIASEINNDKMFKDSVIAFVDIIKESSDVEDLPQEELDILNKLEPFRINLKNDPEKQQPSMLFTAEFANAASMTEAFAALELLVRDETDVADDIKSTLNRLKLNSSYTWNGKSMSRRSFNTMKEEVVEEDIDDLNDREVVMKMVMDNGEYTVRYHFLKEVKSVSNNEAMLSLDGKTVIVKAPLSSVNRNSDILNINVEIKK